MDTHPSPSQLLAADGATSDLKTAAICAPACIRTRLLAAAALIPLSSGFLFAAWLEPSPKGYGTHQQLGQPACLMPMLTGHPCPTCGMTTALAYAVRGQLLQSFHAQPAGFILFLTMIAASVAAIRLALTGQTAFFQPSRLPRPRWIVCGVLSTLLLGWAYKFLTFTP